MASEVNSTLYRAFSPKAHGYFEVAYGPDYNLPVTTQTVKELAQLIAYYWWKYEAQLEVSTDCGVTWEKADNGLQASFIKMLDGEFLQYEVY